MKVSPDIKSLGIGNLYLVERPSGIFYAENSHKERVSLRTRNRGVAEDILRGHKASVEKPNFAYKVALAYLGETDPEASSRTWLDVIDAFIKRSTAGPTRLRLETAKKDKAFQKILKLNLLQDRPRQSGLFFEALNAGGISTNIYLRRFHNFALDMSWIAAPIIPRRQWPKVRYPTKRAITADQYQQIIGREQNPQKLAFYQLLWHLGGSQTDIACLTAEAIDLTTRTVHFPRKKNQQTCSQRFGDECAAILETLPKLGFLLPSIARLGEGDRATYFTHRCRSLGIQGISLHSFRYSWAERAAAVGMPERYAMMALGHKSRAIHQAYSKNLVTTIDSLEVLTKKREAELKATAPVISPDFGVKPAAGDSDKVRSAA
jgi:integrase